MTVLGGGVDMLDRTGSLASSIVGMMTPRLSGCGGSLALPASKSSGNMRMEPQMLSVRPRVWCTVEWCVFLFLAKIARVRRAAGVDSGRHSTRKIAVSVLASSLACAGAEHVLCLRNVEGWVLNTPKAKRYTI